MSTDYETLIAQAEAAKAKAVEDAKAEIATITEQEKTLAARKRDLRQVIYAATVRTRKTEPEAKAKK